MLGPTAPAASCGPVPPALYRGWNGLLPEARASRRALAWMAPAARCAPAPPGQRCGRFDAGEALRFLYGAGCQALAARRQGSDISRGAADGQTRSLLGNPDETIRARASRF